MSENLFKENQSNSKIILIIFSIPLVFFIYGAYRQLFLGIPLGDKPSSDVGILVFIIIYCSFLVFIFSMKLNTIVDHNGIKISFRPFFKSKYYTFDNIKSISVQRYSPYKQYLGHGYRKGFDGSSAYTIGGNYGMLITLVDGSKLLIGTQKNMELKQSLREISPQYN